MHPRGLVGRQYLGLDLGDAGAFGHCLGAAAVVAGQQVAGDALRLQGLHSRAGTGLEDVAKGEQAQYTRCRGLLDQPGQGMALLFPGLCLSSQGAGERFVLGEQVSVAQCQGPPLDLADDALTADHAGLLGRLHRHALHLAGLEHGMGQRVLAATLQAARQCQHVAGIVVTGLPVHQAWAARRQRAGLVEDHLIHGMGALQGLGVLDQDTVAGGHPRAGHDRRRRGQPQCTGAGDHQHGDRVDHRHLGLGACPQPAQQGAQGHQQDDRDEHLADPVHQFLDRRLGRLGLFDQANDAGQHGLGADRHGTDPQGAIDVDGAARHRVAGSLGHGPAFAADQRFIDQAVAVEDLAIDRETLAWLDPYLVAHAQLADRDVLFPAVDHPDRPVRAQGLEGTQGAGGLALGAALQVLAQQDQGDDHRRGFEIHVWGRTWIGHRPLVQAQSVASAGPERDQLVHVAGPGAQALPGGDVETGAEHELHGRGEQPLRPDRQHDVHAERLQGHGQYQRRGQQQGKDQGRALAEQVLATCGVGLLRLFQALGAVAGVAHGRQQGVDGDRAEHLDLGAFAGQVDARL